MFPKSRDKYSIEDTIRKEKTDAETHTKFATNINQLFPESKDLNSLQKGGIYVMFDENIFKALREDYSRFLTPCYIKIPYEKLYFCFDKIGNGFIYDFGTDGKHIATLIGEDSIQGMNFAHVCERLKNVIDSGIKDKPYCLKEIEYFMTLGKDGIYNLDKKEDKIFLLKYGDGYTLFGGNKRSIALYMLGEREIEATSYIISQRKESEDAGEYKFGT